EVNPSVLPVGAEVLPRAEVESPSPVVLSIVSPEVTTGVSVVTSSLVVSPEVTTGVSVVTSSLVVSPEVTTGVSVVTSSLVAVSSGTDASGTSKVSSPLVASSVVGSSGTDASGGI